MAGRLPVAVVLGPVGPAPVTGVFDRHCRFVPDPGDAEFSLAAIRAGKHVLPEKPFASNADEARVVRDAAAAALSIMEGFHYLYHRVTHRLQELLDSGDLGELRAVEIGMFMPAPDDSDPRWSYELAGGALIDAGLGFPGGATGRARCNTAAGHDDRIIVITAAGTRTGELGRRSSCAYQLEAFAAHLRDGARYPPTPTTRSPTYSSSTRAAGRRQSCLAHPPTEEIFHDRLR